MEAMGSPVCRRRFPGALSMAASPSLSIAVSTQAPAAGQRRWRGVCCTAARVSTARLVTATMQVPLLDLKGQYAPLRAEIETAIREVCDEQRFVLGPQSRRARGAGRRVLADEARPRLVVGHRCAAAGADGARHRRRATKSSRRRSRSSRRPASIARLGARPFFCDIDPAHVQPRSGRRSRRDRGALRAARRPARQSRDRRSRQGAAARASVRPDGRPRRVHGARAPVSARRRRGCRAGDRRRARGRQARRQRRRRRLLVVLPDQESRRIRRRRHVRHATTARCTSACASCACTAASRSTTTR